MTASAKTYNGWTNYETWAVNLWMDNEPGSQDEAASMARAAFRNASATEYSTRQQVAAYELADELKAMHQDQMPEAVNGSVYADLLGAALDSVNWHEIAMSLLEELEDDELPEGETEDED